MATIPPISEPPATETVPTPAPDDDKELIWLDGVILLSVNVAFSRVAGTMRVLPAGPLNRRIMVTHRWWMLLFESVMPDSFELELMIEMDKPK